MSWTNEEVSKFQTENNLRLAEINASLKPDGVKGSGKIGIFCQGQVGDLATCMSVLKYRKELWDDKEIIWYANWPNADLLRYAPIDEVRPWPWAGNGLPEGTPDFYPLLCDENNRLKKDLAKQYELTKDLEDGYFPAPHQLSVDKRIDYPSCSKMVFGISDEKQWHPLLSWSDEERSMVSNTMLKITQRKNVILETYFGSGQSIFDDLFTIRSIELCREKWGACNFLFASHKNTERFRDFEGYISLADFTPRVASLFINYADLFIGVSSGMSVVTSAYGLKPVPKIQYCGSYTCSTVALSLGEISLITSDDKPLEQSKQEYYTKLKEVISRIK